MKARKLIYGDKSSSSSAGQGTASDRIRDFFGVESNAKLKLIKDREKKKNIS